MVFDVMVHRHASALLKKGRSSKDNKPTTSKKDAYTAEADDTINDIY